MRPIRFVWFIGCAAVCLIGCDKPCENTAQCGDGEMCAAALCQALTCERTIFAVDPQTRECVPLSGCFLTDEQRTWRTCDSDPCKGLTEDACLFDARCQPVYQDPSTEASALGPAAEQGGLPAGCFSGGTSEAFPQENGLVSAPGVNNGERPKHPLSSGRCLAGSTQRSYSACHALPKIEPQRLCEELQTDECKLRRDCTTDPNKILLRNAEFSAPEGASTDASGAVQRNLGTGECFSLFSRPTKQCEAASGPSCLISPGCQPLGTRCYCPPGAECSCDGGALALCEANDHLRRCRSSADCRADERCDNDEACITPRTYENLRSLSAAPGSTECVGACVPMGCAGLGEKMCNEHPECDGGTYGTVCRPKAYCASSQPTGSDFSATGSAISACGCDSEFVSCGARDPAADIRADRSLLIRDVELVDDPAFRLDTVLAKLAPVGRVDEFTRQFLEQVNTRQFLSNGADTRQRIGFGYFLSELSPNTPGLTARLASRMHTTALLNRVDLAKPGDCGEARLTFALTSAYSDGNQRMTMIVELRVPDDGNGCRSVAQRWAELSLIEDVAERRARLVTLYFELLKPETLGQIRTNEFLNRTGKEPWELREFRLNGSGMLELSAVSQTVDRRFVKDTNLLSWMKQNAAAIQAGNAVIPAQYLAAASTEDGGRLSFGSSDSTVQAAEKALNAQSCAGCHLTETQSPFVHIGERLGRRVGGSFLPGGRAVIDEFLQKELVARTQNLRRLLSSSSVQSLAPLPQTGQARVH